MTPLNCTVEQSAYPAILESLPVQLAVLNARGDILSTNLAWKQDIARPDSPIAGSLVPGGNFRGFLRTYASRFGPQFDVLAEGLDGVLGGSERNFSTHFTCPESQRWIHIQVVACHANCGMSLVIRDDISAKQAAAADIAQRALVTEHTTNAVIIADTNRRITYVNEGFTRLSGFQLSELDGKSVNPLCFQEADPAERQRVREMLDRGEGVRCERLTKAKDGRPYWLAMEIQPIRNGTGPVTGWIIVGNDVTEQVKLRKRLSEYEERLRLTLDSARLGTWELNIATGEIIVDESWLKIMDVPEAHRASAFDYWKERIHPEDQKRIRDSKSAGVFNRNDIVRSDYRIVTPGGHTLWIQETSRVIERTASGAPLRLVGVVADITPLNEAIQEVKRTAERLSMGAAAANLGVWDDDFIADKYYWNDRMLEIHGVKKPYPSANEYLKLIHPDDVDRASKEIQAGMASGREFQTQFRIRRPDGEIRHVEVHAVMHRTPDGRPSRSVGVTMDVTERTMLAIQSQQAQKLESIGQLAAGIAHEINTPSQYVGDNLRFLTDAFDSVTELLSTLQHLAANSRDIESRLRDAIAHADVAYLMKEIPGAIAEARDGMERITTIVRAMKDFSHPSTERVPIDINRAIESTVTVARNEWKYVAQVDSHLDPDLPLVPVVPGEFNQVMLNLLVNAAHAIAETQEKESMERGRIAVTTRRCGDEVEVVVADNGCGMPPEVCERVFEPFFTTKAVGKGTGQGLPLARNIICGHGGTISVASAPGEGTCFTLRLPLGVAATIAAA